MKLNEYQELSKRTMPVHENPIEKQHAATNYALGLCGEAGEVADIIKKNVYHLHNASVEDIKKEIGDTLHYLSGLATIFGFTLEEVATGNIEKLRKRYPDGFNTADSIARKDVQA